MKRISLLLAFFMPLIVFCQKQGHVWLFGNQQGLNFNSGAPIVFSGGQTGTNLGAGDNQEGTSCISDSSGALLFYANGKGFWNRNHQVMLNGSGIMGGISSTQAALIVPQPGNDSLFYVFTSDELQSYGTPPRKGYRYSVVNMCMDNGLGGVKPDKKNIFLADSATEKLAGCIDASGTGYWILGHKLFSDQFTAWRLGNTGITGTVTSNTGIVHGWWPNPPSWYAGMAQGQMKFNPAGTKIALVMGNYQPAVLELLDFNTGTGAVSNPCRIVSDSALLKTPYGVEFSPDGSKVYIGLSGGSGPNTVYQYDLSAGGCNAIRSSSIQVYQSASPPAVMGMQLGPDKKIYAVSGSNLAVINSPNLSGTACNFNPAGLSAATFSNTYTLPSFIAGYTYLNKLVSCPALIKATSSSSIICAGEQATITVSGPATSYTWNTGPTASVIVVSPSVTTTYTVWASGSGMASGVTTTITQIVSPCTALKQLHSNLSIRVFPNPSRGSINISSSVEIDRIEVSDALGKLLYMSQPGSLSHVLTLPDPGVYIICVYAGKEELRQKIIIEPN